MRPFLFSISLLVFASGCLSVRIPLNTPPPYYKFEEPASESDRKSNVDSVKVSLIKPVVLFGGLGYAAGAAKYDTYGRTPFRDRLTSSQAFTGLGIGAMSGLILGHSRQRILRRNISESLKHDKNKDSVSKAYIIIPALAIGAYGTALGYAIYANPDTSPTASEHTEAIIIGGGIGSSIGIGLGWFVREIVKVEKRKRQKAAIKKLQEESADSKK